MSLPQLIQANGWFFGLTFALMSIFAVYLVVLRIIKNVKAKCDHEAFLIRLEEALSTGGGKAAYQLCQSETQENASVMPKLYLAAFDKGGEAIKGGRDGRIDARDAIADVIETKIMPSLQSWLPLILLLAKISPMVGLLGTVSGMIGAFGTIAGATKVDPSALANDIGMALFTTAEGLVIAIPLILAYTVFQERVRRYEIELQLASQEALKMVPKVFGKPAAR